MALRTYPYMLTYDDSTITGKEEALSTAGIIPQELGVSISIRIGMPMLAAMVSLAAFIHLVEGFE